MKIRYIIISILLLLIPFNVNAFYDYHDVVGEISNVKVSDDIINIYIFHGDGCPHCKKAIKWLDTLPDKYDNKVKIVKFEVWKNLFNLGMMQEVSDKLNVTTDGVPFIIIGDEYFMGFDDNDVIKTEITSCLDRFIKGEDAYLIHIPILGDIDKRKISLPLVAIILGFIDGFNPCAMWILLLLINLFISSNNRKKALVLGITFLLTSGLIYFMSMFGISTVISLNVSNILKILLALFIIGAGIYNGFEYLKLRKSEAGCNVVDKKKRKKIINKVNAILAKKSFTLSMIGIITLAISVNLIELACSLGFPVVFTSLLAFNKVGGALKVLYLLLYILFYMLDDMVVFAISMLTLSATGITNKYNKLCKLISAIIMIIMGILLLIKPEWLMFNF